MKALIISTAATMPAPKANNAKNILPPPSFIV